MSPLWPCSLLCCVDGHRPCVRHPKDICERYHKLDRCGYLCTPSDLHQVLTSLVASTHRSSASSVRPTSSLGALSFDLVLPTECTLAGPGAGTWDATGGMARERLNHGAVGDAEPTHTPLTHSTARRALDAPAPPPRLIRVVNEPLLEDTVAALRPPPTFTSVSICPCHIQYHYACAPLRTASQQCIPRDDPSFPPICGSSPGTISCPANHSPSSQTSIYADCNPSGTQVTRVYG